MQGGPPLGGSPLSLPPYETTALVTGLLRSIRRKFVHHKRPKPGDEVYEQYQVPIYGRAPGREYVSIGKFLGLIQNPFPALAAWRLCERTGIHNQTFLLDNFEGQSSRAWDELIFRNRVYLVPDGDAVSPYISAADLLLRALDRQLTRNQTRVERDSVRTALLQIGHWDPDAELHVHTIT